MTSTPPLQFEQRLADIVASSDELMAALKAARLIGLQSWCIGAGAVRSLVWDVLHGFEGRSPVEDLDLDLQAARRSQALWRAVAFAFNQHELRAEFAQKRTSPGSNNG